MNQLPAKPMLFLLLLFLLGRSLEAQNHLSPGKNFRCNLIKINIIPIGPYFNGHNQKWAGIEYERFLNPKLSLSAIVDVGLFEDYTFIKYHNFFDENGSFSYTRTDVTTWGYHLIPAIRYYFLTNKSRNRQGFYLGGKLDMNQYFKKTEVYHSASGANDHKSSATTRLSAGAVLGGQYMAFSRLVIDLNISVFVKLFSSNGSNNTADIKPLHATWFFNNNAGWSTVNLMIGYAFGGGKRK